MFHILEYGILKFLWAFVCFTEHSLNVLVLVAPLVLSGAG